MVLIALLVLGLLVFEVSIADLPAVKIFTSKTLLNHMVVDSINTGEVYVGAVNYLYHLSPTLKCYEERNTGPRKDSIKCLPEYGSHCEVHLRNSSNQLLILWPKQERLIVCSSLLMGTCMQLNASNISDVVFQHKELSYNLMVASNDPKVPSVAVIVNLPNPLEPTLLVGTGKPLAEDFKPISTRSLTGDEIFITKDNLELRIKKETNYQFHFILAFQENKHAYVLFTRLAKDGEDKNKRKTYLSSLCVPHHNYESYIEVPLSCGEKDVAKDAFVGAIGTQLAMNMNASKNENYANVTADSKALFVSFISHESATDKTDTKSAICAFTLLRLDLMLKNTRTNCYDGDLEKAFVQYGSLNCKESTSTTNTAEIYPCGGDHLVHPITGKEVLSLTPLLTYDGVVTAIASTTEEHLAFIYLGTQDGDLLKAFLYSTEVTTETLSMGRTNSAILPDMEPDRNGSHLYVMAGKKIMLVETQHCSEHTDCMACIEARDASCGWCLFEGRCTRHSDCPNTSDTRWLWSYNRHCLQPIVTPRNASRNAKSELELQVDGLPDPDKKENFRCSFNNISTPATRVGTLLKCNTPDTDAIPWNTNADIVILDLVVMYGHIRIGATNFTFFDCSAIVKLNKRAPCTACVGSPWPCHWCVLDHRCSATLQCEGAVIHNEQNSSASNGLMKGPAACPRISSFAENYLIPAETSLKVTVIAQNLNLLVEPKYQCEFDSEVGGDQTTIQPDAMAYESGFTNITCNAHKFNYKAKNTEFLIPLTLRWKKNPYAIVDNPLGLKLPVYKCSVGREDCSLCQTADAKLGCTWCAKYRRCVFKKDCPSKEEHSKCPPPRIVEIFPKNGTLDGGARVTIKGHDLGQKREDIESVTVVNKDCEIDDSLYSISSSIVCLLSAVTSATQGNVSVKVKGQEVASFGPFNYMEPKPEIISPQKGPVAGGTQLTVSGTKLNVGMPADVEVEVGGNPCSVDRVTGTHIICKTTPFSGESSNMTVKVIYKPRTTIPLPDSQVFLFTPDPEISEMTPTTSFFSGGREITVKGSHLDSVTHPIMRAVVSTVHRRRRSHRHQTLSSEYKSTCKVDDAKRMRCQSPKISAVSRGQDSIEADIQFIMDNVVRNYSSIQYFADPTMLQLNVKDSKSPYTYKLDTILRAEGQNLERAMSKEEVQAWLGNIPCPVTTLIDNYLYCNPESDSEYPKKPVNFTVVMGNLKFNLGPVEYENAPAMKLKHKIALAIGAVVLALSVITIIYIYRRKSKKAIRDYKKVQVQLESLETNVRDTCKKQFTDLMTEMNDMSGDLMGSGTPFLDYKLYAERVFFPGLDSPLSRELDVPAAHKVTIEHGLNQLSNLLNSKLFLTTFIHTLESQRTFTARDRGYVASLLTVALHSKLEYYTDILKLLLKDLMDQYVAKNPKLMLRRTETVVEKMLTNWMSICLYNFLKEKAGESLFMLYKAIKHQVEKGPVDAVIKKAKYSLNDNRLLGEDVEYQSLVLHVAIQNSGQEVPTAVRVLDCDSVTQAKEKIIEQVYKNLSYSQRPTVNAIDLEWRNGRAGHLLLCDEDVTSIDDGRWKKINTLQHYKVPNEASVALVSQLGNTQDYQGHFDHTVGEKSPMLEDGEDGGKQLWHLVKASDDVDAVRKNRRSSSMRERDRTKAIPEIYLTRLLSMKGILQKFVDDFFRVVLSTSLTVPHAVKYFFDFLDQQAEMNGINDSETIHIWKTNSLPLRFWVNILKNPHFVFDVHVSDIVDASLSVIAQTFMDSCTTTDQRLGRDSPINKLLYAREINGYKKMVEKYYSDIRQMIPVSDQEMNTQLAEESRAHSHELNSIVALHELYKYVIKYYDEIISALESNEAAQKIELAYRLQQVAAEVENKVTEV
uniref:plexin-B1-like isoform X3 n=1 Tax=Myxine glutinosa TaxID=7769 RepID=UPI00358EDA3B